MMDNSKISHLVGGAENLKDELASAPTNADGVDHFDTLPSSNSPRADIQLQEKEDEQNNSDLLFSFLNFVADDTVVQGIVGCMIDGITKRSEIAASLKVNDLEITHARKRLDRRCKEFSKLNADKNPFKTSIT
jgi:hypothetical protein